MAIHVNSLPVLLLLATPDAGGVTFLKKSLFREISISYRNLIKIVTTFLRKFLFFFLVFGTDWRVPVFGAPMFMYIHRALAYDGWTHENRTWINSIKPSGRKNKKTYIRILREGGRWKDPSKYRNLFFSLSQYHSSLYMVHIWESKNMH